MKHFLLIIFGISLAFSSSSQNYQTVNSSEVKLFQSTSDSFTRGYRIDSVIIEGNDSLLYPSRTIQNETEEWDECTNVFGPSMLGDYVRIMPDGTNLFFNLNEDTIRVKTRAQPGDSWVLWAGDIQL